MGRFTSIGPPLMSNPSHHPPRMRFAVALLFCVALIAGCDQQAAIDRITPPEEAALAKRVLAQVAAREFLEVEKLFDPGLRGPQARASLEQMAQQFPAGEPRSIRTVGAFTSKNTTSNAVTHTVTFEYEYPGSWLLAEAVLQRRDAELVVLGVQVKRLERPLEESNRFSFAGKGIAHYAFLAIAVAIPLFIAYALAVCLKTPIPRRKWLWYIFIALGLVQVSLNWTSGALSIQPISLLLLGASFYRSGPVGPIVVSFALPLGAVVFLARRRSLVKQGGG